MPLRLLVRSLGLRASIRRRRRRSLPTILYTVVTYGLPVRLVSSLPPIPGYPQL